MANDQVRNNEGKQRFEMDANGSTAFANYRESGDVLTITHTEVPAELRGHGIGKRLARGMLDLMRAEGQRVVPQCPFIAHFIKHNPDYQDLVAE